MDAVAAAVVEVTKMVKEVEEAETDLKQQRQITRQIIGIDKMRRAREEAKIVTKTVIASKIRIPGSTSTTILKDLTTLKVHLLKTLRSQKCQAKTKDLRNHQKVTLIKKWHLMID